MTPPVTGRERWAALGLLAAALLLAYGLLVHPWWTVPIRAENARIAQLQARDARLRAELDQAPAVRQRLEDARQRLASRPGFLPEATAELAVAGLVQRLETVVVQASPGNRSCQISNRSPMPPQGNDAYTRVVVQVRLRCGSPELAAVLHALEAGAPRLFVENLNVLAQRFFFAGPDAAGRDGGLDVSFDLAGYLAPPGVAGEGATPPPSPALPSPAAASMPALAAVDAVAMPMSGPAAVDPAAAPPPAGMMGPRTPSGAPITGSAPVAGPPVAPTPAPAAPPSGGPDAP